MRQSPINIIHVCIAVFILVVGVTLWIAVNSATIRTTHPTLLWSTQLRGIHQGLVTFANSYKNYFPGLDNQGNFATWQVEDNGPDPADPYAPMARQVGIAVKQRVAMLIAGGFFTPDNAVSYLETDPIIKPWEEGDGPITANHYSFAMLQVPGPPRADGITKPAGRHTEWSTTLNSQAVVVSDRNLGSAAQPRSIHNEFDADAKGDPWRGSVLWNDNHVAFENSHLFETKYGGIEVPNDHLFIADNENDAYLIHTGN